MVVDRTGKLELTGAINHDFVDNNTYLGFTITNNGSCDYINFRRRIGIIWQRMPYHSCIKSSQLGAVSSKQNVNWLTPYFSPSFGTERRSVDAEDRPIAHWGFCKVECWRKMLRIPWKAQRTNRINPPRIQQRLDFPPQDSRIFRTNLRQFSIE